VQKTTLNPALCNRSANARLSGLTTAIDIGNTSIKFLAEASAIEVPPGNSVKSLLVGPNLLENPAANKIPIKYKILINHSKKLT
jgi:hypothetical protein